MAVTEGPVREEQLLHDLCLLGAVTVEITQILTRAGLLWRKYIWTPLKIEPGLVMWWSVTIYNLSIHAIMIHTYTHAAESFLTMHTYSVIYIITIFVRSEAYIILPLCLHPQLSCDTLIHTHTLR